jgi:hypothetical protein
MRRISGSVLVGCLLLGATSVRSDSALTLPPGEETRSVLAVDAGDPDPVTPHRGARRLDLVEIGRAVYRGSRSEQIAALNALAGRLEEERAALGLLAALMNAGDRGVAGRAAYALETQLARLAGDPVGFAEVPPAQVAQLLGQLFETARDTRLDLDIRIVSLEGIALLGRQGFAIDESLFVALLEDDEPVVAETALGCLGLPLADETLLRLSEIERGPRFSALVGGVLCENALAHGVEAPSDDLATLLMRLIEDDDVPSEAVAPILACLARFSTTARVDLVDAARGREDPALDAFWKALSSY